MPLGKAGDSDAESPRVGRRRVRPDEPNELLGVLERIARPVVAGHRLRGGSPPRARMFSIPGRGVAIEDRGQLVFAVADAGQVRDGRQVVSRWIRTIRSWVRSRVEPPAP